MDGLPGMKRGVETGRTDAVKPIKKMVGPLAPAVIGVPRRAKQVYTAGHLILAALLSSLLTAAVLILLLLVYGPGSSSGSGSMSRPLWLRGKWD